MNKINYNARLLFILGTACILSCKKQNNKPEDCYANEVTYRTLLNAQATIKKSPDNNFFIIEQGTIDTKLNPCNLQDDFKIDSLQVIVTGNVKRTERFGFGPCCIEDFVISSIRRQ